MATNSTITFISIPHLLVVRGDATTIIMYSGDLPVLPIESPALVEGPQNEQTIAFGYMDFYWAGCDGLRALAQRLNHPIYKIGALFYGTPYSRFKGLNDCGYGAFMRSRENPSDFTKAPGFMNWHATPNRPEDFNRIPLPANLKIHNNMFRVEYGPDVDPYALDGFVRTALACRELSAWATTADGRALCHAAGIDPDTLTRFKREPVSGAYCRVTELYAFHPKRDREWFVAVLAEALKWASRPTAA